MCLRILTGIDGVMGIIQHVWKTPWHSKLSLAMFLCHLAINGSKVCVHISMAYSSLFQKRSIVKGKQPSLSLQGMVRHSGRM